MNTSNFKNEENFEFIKNKAEALYASIGAVHNPYFGEKVLFNAKGIRHIKFKSDQNARSHQDQYFRLKLLHLAPQVIRFSRL